MWLAVAAITLLAAIAFIALAFAVSSSASRSCLYRGRPSHPHVTNRRSSWPTGVTFVQCRTLISER